MLWVKTLMLEIQIIKENLENILLTRVVKLFNFGSARVFSELFPVCKKNRQNAVPYNKSCCVHEFS